MKVQVLQHVPFEGLGSMAAWLGERDADIRYTKFFDGDALPDPRQIDAVIAMGGPMSVNDEHGYPWLRAEKTFVRQAIRYGLPVLGVCLGAQLIASALGARVYANAHREIGWFPVDGANGGTAFRFPPGTTVFHWHGETFDLPPGAVRIATNAVCRNQGFQLGRNVIGLQFHLETTPESARDIVENCRDELSPSAWVQSETEILAALPERCRTVNELMGDVLAHLLRIEP